MIEYALDAGVVDLFVPPDRSTNGRLPLTSGNGQTGLRGDWGLPSLPG